MEGINVEVADFGRESLMVNDSSLRAKMSDRISLRAKELGLKQSDIVRHTGAAKATVNRWFNGSIPRGEHAVKLRQLLRVSQDYLDGTSDSPIVNNEAQLYSVLDSTASAESMRDLSTLYVQVPRLTKNGVDQVDNLVAHRELLPSDCKPSDLAWMPLSTDTGSGRFSRGDIVVIDMAEDLNFVSGSYYAFSAAGSVAVYMVEFSPFADEFVIHDGSHGGQGTQIAANGHSLGDLAHSLLRRVVYSVMSM